MSSPDDKFIITREAMDNFNEWIVEAGRRKKILLDLIAELRECPGGTRTESKGDVYWALPYIDALAAKDVIDRAEARLREVTGDE